MDERRRRRRDDDYDDNDRTITPGMSEEEIERIVRYRVKKRQDKQREFIIHAGIYIMINGGLWFLWATEAGGFPWPFIVMAGWGIGLFAHFMDMIQSFSSVQSRRDAIVQREIEREKERIGLYEKPKRESLQKSKRAPMRVSDDGELEPVDDADYDDEEEDAPRYRQNNRRG